MRVDRARIIPEKKIGFSSSVEYTQNHRPKSIKRSSNVVKISRSYHQNSDQNIYPKIAQEHAKIQLEKCHETRVK